MISFIITCIYAFTDLLFRTLLRSLHTPTAVSFVPSPTHTFLVSRRHPLGCHLTLSCHLPFAYFTRQRLVPSPALSPTHSFRPLTTPAFIRSYLHRCTCLCLLSCCHAGKRADRHPLAHALLPMTLRAYGDATCHSPPLTLVPAVGDSVFAANAQPTLRLLTRTGIPTRTAAYAPSISAAPLLSPTRTPRRPCWHALRLAVCSTAPQQGPQPVGHALRQPIAPSLPRLDRSPVGCSHGPPCASAVDRAFLAAMERASWRCHQQADPHLFSLLVKQTLHQRSGHPHHRYGGCAGLRPHEQATGHTCTRMCALSARRAHLRATGLASSSPPARGK